MTVRWTVIPPNGRSRGRRSLGFRAQHDARAESCGRMLCLSVTHSVRGLPNPRRRQVEERPCTATTPFTFGMTPPVGRETCPEPKNLCRSAVVEATNSCVNLNFFISIPLPEKTTRTDDRSLPEFSLSKWIRNSGEDPFGALRRKNPPAPAKAGTEGSVSQIADDPSKRRVAGLVRPRHIGVPVCAATSVRGLASYRTSWYRLREQNRP
jgi:hypothetical protein